MPITKPISSRANAKQLTGADVPQFPTTLVTNKYTAVSTAGQTIVTLSFAVDQANKNNFMLVINGKVYTEGASNDFTFINIQPNNTSSQIQLNAALVVNLNIQAWYLGVSQSNYSLASLTAAVNANSLSIPKNYLLNSNFDFWQRGTTVTVANAVSTYLADRWYVKNTLGTNGVITYSQVAGTNNGALFAAKVQITTAPTAAQTNGTALYQVIENLESLELYNQVISASAQIKALGNVTQVGLQFLYNTSEIKPTLALGTESLITVNTSTFTLGTLLNQSVGTTPTTTGVVAFRIRITAVSTGNTWDLNNGFIVEQAKLNIGQTAANYSRAASTLPGELMACQRFYEKSYDLVFNPGSVTVSGEHQVQRVNSTATENFAIRFAVSKRDTGSTVTVYSPATGASGQIRNQSAASDVAASVINAGMTGATLSWSAAAGAPYSFHYTAESEI